MRWLIPLFSILLLGCKKPSSSFHDSASASTSHRAALSAEEKPPLAETLPISPTVDKMLNPGGQPEYTGPTGTIEGTIFVDGEPVSRSFQKVPDGCDKAITDYRFNFRKGPNKELADAYVAVIGVSGFVRPNLADKHISIDRCSIEPRTIDLTFGQRLLIGTRDSMSYLPQSADLKPVTRVVIRGQEPVPLLFEKVGFYGLTWFVGALPGSDVPTALVYVFRSGLHAVTSTSGAFRISGIPIGRVKLITAHPALGELSESVDIRAGEVTKKDFTFVSRRKTEVTDAGGNNPRVK